MKQIVIEQEKEPLKNPLVNDMYRLRHETFIGRLDWEINSIDGMERDQFDDLLPYHIAVQNKQGGIDGCWRALPTTGDYMLKDVFPELLQGEQAPQQSEVWEISRFAVRRGTADQYKGMMSEVTVAMVRSFLELAQQKNIRAYVAVTTVACERLLRQLGVSLRRMGNGRALQVGKERSVALWIEVNDQLDIRTH